MLSSYINARTARTSLGMSKDNRSLPSNKDKFSILPYSSRIYQDLFIAVRPTDEEKSFKRQFSATQS